LYFRATISPPRCLLRTGRVAERSGKADHPLAHLAASESWLAEAPTVVGHVRPLILMPVGMLAGLSPTQIESILLHELAHIQRHDYLMNTLQRYVEGLLFYHPAVWWISAIIRREREHCCDDLALSISGEPHEYARALAALEQNRFSPAAVAATGGSLVKRIYRCSIRELVTRGLHFLP
jgi:beta-lactamase regulating signal transducer with metallopeptidase domain